MLPAPPPFKIMSVLDFIFAWADFKKKYWHLLDDVQKKSYAMDQEDGYLPPTEDIEE
jgi:hypothetical protein